MYYFDISNWHFRFAYLFHFKISCDVPLLKLNAITLMEHFAVSTTIKKTIPQTRAPAAETRFLVTRRKQLWDLRDSKCETLIRYWIKRSGDGANGV